MNTKNTLIAIVALLATTATFAQVGIGTTTPHASAALDVESTTKGFLPPRMTDVQRDAIAGPTSGLTIYNTDSNCLQWFAGGFWYDACSGSTSPAPNPNLTAATPTYQGVSVIDATGIGYNGETVPAASTITVQLSNASATPQEYGLLATDPATGLQYSATGTIAGSASNVAVILTHNEVSIPWQTYGVITMSLQGTSSTLNLVPRIDIKSIPATETQVTDVVYGTQTWMDRNLGARRVATAITDVLSYGNHYQWGRPADGHEITVWNGATPTDGRGFENTTATLFDNTTPVTFPTPGHPNFITSSSTPFDWISPQASPDNDRWTNTNQGPCPTGYHVPTNTEWNTADAAALGSGNGTNGTNTTGWDNNTETYESALKLPSAGLRLRTNGLLNFQGTSGHYWSSSVSGTLAHYLYFHSTAAYTLNLNRATGFSVRCLKD